MNIEQISNLIAWTIIILIIVAICKIIKKIFSLIKYIFDEITRRSNKKYNDWNDLERIILHTKTSAGMPKNEFIPNKEILNRFFRNPYNIENLNNAANDILAHAGYNGPAPTIQYGLTGNDVSTHVANECRAYITINSQPKKSPYILYAILIHECMNLVIFYNNINYGMVNKNMPAETMAVYMGFYNYISNYSSYAYKNDINYIYNKIYR